MRKKKDSQRAKVNFTAIIQRKSAVLKSLAVNLWKNARPFLAPRYWPIYLIAFCLGFFIWGPLHGWQKFHSWQIHQSTKRPNLPAAVTLQHQLDRLKKELQTAQNEKVSEFNPASFSRPALGQVIRGFEWVETDNSWRLNDGVDISAPSGSNILAAAAGTVTEVTQTSPGNYLVAVNHGSGWESTYSNLTKVLVFKGQQIIKGVIIGTSGNKGFNPAVPSFHFAIYQDQQPVDPGKVINGLSK